MRTAVCWVLLVIAIALGLMVSSSWLLSHSSAGSPAALAANIAIGDVLSHRLDQDDAVGPQTAADPGSGGSPLPYTDGLSIGLNNVAPTCASVGSAGWAVVAALPEPVYGPAVATDGNFVYAAGGYDLNTGNPVEQFVRYDPLANTWVLRPPLTIPVDDALAVYANGKIYVFGGESALPAVLTTTQIYDIAADVWTLGPPLPAPRQQMAGGFYNGKIYLTGGTSGGTVSDAQKRTWEFDVASGTYVTKTDLPVALLGAASQVVGSHLYVIGGRNAANSILATVYDYDIVADIWTPRAPLPMATNLPGSAVYFGKIWVLGGSGPGGPFSPAEVTAEAGAAAVVPQTTNVTQIYDPASDTWQAGPPQTVARSFQGAATVGNVIVSVGGYDGVNSSVVTEVPVQVPLRVAIAYADAHTVPVTLTNQLRAFPSVGVVDTFDVETATVTLAQFMPYDVVVVFDNSAFSDTVALGNVLADYQDAGGVVVGAEFIWYSSPFTLGGRWITGNYSPFSIGAPADFLSATLGIYDHNSLLIAGVHSLSAFYRLAVMTTTGATLVASWSDAEPAIAAKGRAVGINAYLGSYADFWVGDFAQVIVNAGFSLRSRSNICSRVLLPLVAKDTTIP